MLTPRRHWPETIKPRVAALTLALATCAATMRADEAFRRAPELLSPVCDSVQVPDGHSLSARLFAEGVQVYRWTGTNWAFIAPDANLYADACYEGRIGVHYAGPTWAASDGSKVVAARDAGCTPYRGAIPWLRLKVTASSEYGIFGGITYIQRINTVGGTAPAEAGAFVGDEARVPYTAEYYFYRAARN